MAPRQIWFFTFGCWAALATAAIHLIGAFVLAAPPANDTERQLVALATTYRYALPGGSTRSLMDFMHGFSLSFALFIATIGAVGLVVKRRGQHDALMMMGVSRVLAGASALLLAIALVYFFIVPAFFIALIMCCFAFAAVRAPTIPE